MHAIAVYIIKNTKYVLNSIHRMLKIENLILSKILSRNSYLIASWLVLFSLYACSTV